MSDEPRRLVQHWRIVGRASSDSDLGRVDIAVLWSVLQMINRETGRAFTSLETIADKAQVSVRSVPRSLRRLCELGYLVKHSERGANGSSIFLAGSSDESVTDEVVTDGVVTDESVSDESAGAALTDSSVHTLTDSSVITASIQPHSPTSLLSGFGDFWKRYPRKEAKAKALAIWTKQNLDQHAEAIVSDVAARIADPRQWDDPKYIPHATTYLNQRRWEDEWPRALASAPSVGHLPRETNAEAINAASMARLGIKL